MSTMMDIDLVGRDVLMVGGGQVTARRLRRLLKEGARPRIVAPAVHPHTRELVTEYGLPLVQRPFRTRDLRRTWFVHIATGDPALDRRIAATAERDRTLCVVASDASAGTARLASSTVGSGMRIGVVGESADPRRSRAVRDAISRMLSEGTLPVRRRRPGRVGRVDLVGGGPGPADLMTLRAHRLLAEADVVVVDRLAPRGALRPGDDVQIIDVGKRPGFHPVPQEEINRIIVAHARAGRRVVRLKGGDPFVFGRGGEEVAACLAAGVPVEVTPGITSVTAVPQAAGIPVTHRGTASGLHVVNGQGPLTSSGVRAIADPAVTTIVLMGVAALPGLVARALSEGAPADRPVAIVERGHAPDQRVTRTTLAQAPAAATAAGVRNPAVIVIGDVARAGLLIDAANGARTA